jgi:hypothetical protein
MSLHRQSRPRLYALLVALCLVPSVLVVAAFPWLRQQPLNWVLSVTGIAGILTILASLALAILHDRSIGEWERSNARFSGHWGDAIGTSLVALLLTVPPGREWIVSVVAGWARVPNPDTKLVFLAFALGFGTLVIARVVCMAVVSMGWTFWKSRPVRDPS